jgi:ATP-dependent DNA helicase RecQ
MARLPQRRLEKVLAALRSVRALRGSEADGLRPATRRPPDAVVDAAEAVAQQRQQSSRDGLAAMVLYAKAGGCRWAGVLAHFGEALDGETGRCDHCDSCARFERLLAAERSAPPAEAGKAITEAPAAAFEPGQRVRVRRFGWGEVQTCTAEMVRIEFPRHGVRDIHPDFVLATAARSLLHR